jgi:hypothetical protein
MASFFVLIISIPASAEIQPHAIFCNGPRPSTTPCYTKSGTLTDGYGTLYAKLSFKGCSEVTISYLMSPYSGFKVLMNSDVTLPLDGSPMLVAEPDGEKHFYAACMASNGMELQVDRFSKDIYHQELLEFYMSLHTNGFGDGGRMCHSAVFWDEEHANGHLDGCDEFFYSVSNK